MNKNILSLLFLLLSLTLSDTQAIKIGKNLKQLECKTHNSKKCATVEGFNDELKAQCASESGNCRYVFCKQICTKANRMEASLCRNHCFFPKLLARFSAEKRKMLYKASFVGPNQKSLSLSQKYELAMQALEIEGKVQKLKRGKFINSSAKKEDNDLYISLDDYRKTIMDQAHGRAQKNWKKLKITNQAVKALLENGERLGRKSNISPYKKLISEQQIMVQHLSPTYPPQAVQTMIEDAMKQGIKPEEVVLAFDFDGTLSTKGTKMGTTVLRGGQDFLEFLNWAKESGINLVVDTAAGAGALETLSTQSKQSGIGHIFSVDSNHGIGRKFVTSSLNEGTVITVNGQEEKVAISNNFVTGERPGYNKPHYLKAYLDRKGIQPKLVIFLDDGAVNIVNMWSTFPELMPTVPLLAVHVPQLEKMPGFYAFLGNHDQLKEAMRQELKSPELNGIPLKEKVILAGNNLAEKNFPTEKQPEPGEAGNAAFIAYLKLSGK